MSKFCNIATRVVLFPSIRGEHEYANLVAAALPQCVRVNHNCVHLLSIRVFFW